MSHHTQAGPATFGLGIVNGQPNRVVVERDGAVTALSALSLERPEPSNLIEMFADWETWIDEISAALGAATDLDSQDAVGLAMEAPVIPPTVYCAGTNYYDHVAEMQVRPPNKDNEALFAFNVPSAAVTGHRQTVHRPTGVERLDWEVELAAVIGRPGLHITAEDALDHVAGYTTANDISVRDIPMIAHDIFGVRWMQSKGQATMKPIGPTLIPSRFVPDPTQLGLELSVNGELRQRSNTREMIWSLAEQIEVYSAMVELRPGDLLLTGTPAGTAAGHDGKYLRDGDEVVASVEGVGTLVNVVAPPLSAAP